ncbi:MAG: exodeoxyribonuclease VII large subunit [Agarilytica sp.]
MSLTSPSRSDDLRTTLTVSQLNRKVKDLLEIHLPLLWIEGEISNMSRPASGHWYFTLKDTKAQVSCVMFKGRNLRVKSAPQVGDHVKLRVSVSLYEGRGDYQLIVEHLEQAGFGLLQKRFEELKEKLKAEGLFDSATKQAIPKHIQHLAVVTSPSGAAVRDVISVLKRRFPSLPITIVPSAVQGDEAPAQLINAVLVADQSPDYDAILLCRGGGSIEDLWSFNSEALARTITECSTPVISAVGHEVDFTIADFVADLRAPTPSAAAELLSPDTNEVLLHFSRVESQLATLLRGFIERRLDTLIHLRKRLKHPRDLIQQRHQRLDLIEAKLINYSTQSLTYKKQHIALLHQRLQHHSPSHAVTKLKQDLERLNKSLQRGMQLAFKHSSQRYQQLVSQLDLVSPLATIERGYSVTRDKENKIVRSIQQVNTGDSIKMQVSDGEILANVTSTQEKL